MSDESMLRAQAPGAESGNLPDRRPQRLWGGLGTGVSCAVCGKTVGTEEVEIELQFTADGGIGAASYHVHAPCFAAWERKRRNGGSNGHLLPRGGNGGIITDRERNTTDRGESG